MKSIKSYPTRVEADIARWALEAAGVPSVVVGIGVGTEGGLVGHSSGHEIQLDKPQAGIDAVGEVLRETR